MLLSSPQVNSSERAINAFFTYGCLEICNGQVIYKMRYCGAINYDKEGIMCWSSFSAITSGPRDYLEGLKGHKVRGFKSIT